MMVVKRKKAKGTKKCVIKRRLMVKNYKDSLPSGKNNITIEIEI